MEARQLQKRQGSLHQEPQAGRSDDCDCWQLRIHVSKALLYGPTFRANVYRFAWEFDMAANVHLETRATGILSTMPISASLINGTTQEGRENAKHLGFGTVVSEGVMAANHQHIFSVRIDPMIDGHKNLIV